MIFKDTQKSHILKKGMFTVILLITALSPVI